MTLEEYLNAGAKGFPQRGVKGVPGDWMPVTSLTVSHRSLWAGDPYICDGEDGCRVDVRNGKYIIEAQGYDFGGVRVIGRVRARLASASDVSLGEMVGETGTDSAMIAICDMGSVDAAVVGDNDGFQDSVNRYAFQRFGAVHFQMDGEITIAYVETAFGDGKGPMYTLIKEAECVGIELDFICDDLDD